MDMTLTTTKEVNTSLHDPNDTHRIQFKYRYERNSADAIIVKVDAYKVLDDTTELIAGGSSYRTISGDRLTALIGQAEQLAQKSEDESALEYFDRLVAEGIKIVIASEGLWQGKLSITDFE